MNATIQFTCPQCSHEMRLPASVAGKKGKCPKCAQVIIITAPVLQAPFSPAQAPPLSTSPDPVPAVQADPLMGSMPPAQPPVDPLMGPQAVDPLAGSVSPATPSAVPAGGGGTGMHIGVKVGAGAGGVALLGLLLWLVIKFAGGGADTHEKIIDDYDSALIEFAELINGINSVDDAKSAKPKLEAVASRMQAINERAHAIGNPDKDIREMVGRKLHQLIQGPTHYPGFRKKFSALKNDPEIKAVLDLKELEARVDENGFNFSEWVP